MKAFSTTGVILNTLGECGADGRCLTCGRPGNTGGCADCRREAASIPTTFLDTTKAARSLGILDQTPLLPSTPTFDRDHSIHDIPKEG